MKVCFLWWLQTGGGEGPEWKPQARPPDVPQLQGLGLEGEARAGETGEGGTSLWALNSNEVENGLLGSLSELVGSHQLTTFGRKIFSPTNR